MPDLSICIPVFNFRMDALIQRLASEISAHSLDAEIILIDDASDSAIRTTNREVATKNSARYIQLESNVGRSAIRNQFAKHARSEYLLFLDCDMMPESMDFLRTYLSENGNDRLIVCGGISYADKPSPDKMLHWKFGQAREALSAEMRNTHPHRHFFSSNFLVPLKILKSIRFDETLTGYGYEDSLFAMELERNNIEIKHIQLPAEHLRLDNAPEFISKTEAAMGNLHLLYRRQELRALLTDNIRLIKATERLRKLGLLGIAKSAHKTVGGRMRQRLTTGKSSLALLDWYKLFYFASLQ